MNILLVINNLELGGAQIFVLRLANRLAQKHNVVIYDLSLPGKSMLLTSENSALVSGLNIKYFRFKMFDTLIAKACKYKYLRKIIVPVTEQLRINALRKYIRSNQFEIVNSHLFDADYVAAKALGNLSDIDLPMIISMHGSYETVPKWAYYKIGKVFERTNLVQYLSNKNLACLTSFKGVNDTLFTQIYNGYEPKNQDVFSREKLNISKEALVFVMVARATEIKGWKQAIDAYLKFKIDTKADTALILIGDGAYLDQLKKNYVDEESVIFYGFSENPIALIKMSDIGLLPTYTPAESLPNSIIEYLYAGLGIITTSIGEIQNMIAYNQQQAGFVVKYTQEGVADVEEIVSRMKEYYHNPETLLIHKQLAKHAFSKFDMELCVDAYVNNYAKAINNHKLGLRAITT